MLWWKSRDEKAEPRPPGGKIGTWPPRIAVSSWSARREITAGMSIMEFPGYAKKEFGVKYIEVLLSHLISDEEIQFQSLAEAASSAGVEIVCLALINDFTLPDAALRQEYERTAAALEKAKILGVQVARVNPGMKGEGTNEELVRKVAKGLEHLVPTAAKTGIVLALENHGLFGMKPENITRVLDAVDNPDWVGACLDFGIFYPEELDTGPAKLAPYAVHLHAKSYEFDRNGNETTINYLKRFEELKKANYTGYVSVEWEGDENDVENTNRTIQLIERCIGQLQ